MKVLLVEDDELLGHALATGLKQAAYVPEWVKDGDTALLSLQTNAYSVVILDINLPKLSGLEVLKKMRADAIDVPVIIMTARDNTSDRVKGLDLGADDYVVKPFELPELWARIRAVVRRSHGRANAIITCQDIELDIAARTVKKNGQFIKLTPKEYQVAMFLMERTDRIVDKREIEEHMYAWDQEFESNIVEVTIYSIRKKLGRELIKTLRGVGYMVKS